MSLSPFISGRSGESTSASGWRHSIKDQQCASPLDYRALIRHQQTAELEPLLVDERLGVCDGARWREDEAERE